MQPIPGEWAERKMTILHDGNQISYDKFMRKATRVKRPCAVRSSVFLMLYVSESVCEFPMPFTGICFLVWALHTLGTKLCQDSS